ncbi:hypothetical protein [Tahibacter amnicola]|uniref:DUF3618 domain-containing protein n=1 Tax=Tahibacter amnicola TaxID=2976241 RepID=A0ABY6BMQ6_9GAMM|nr:hypothetical protein [Tahibacter amnicola]UXI70340.1 hypothetical protein N4264_12095 [Tahibacter amnicola]
MRTQEVDAKAANGAVRLKRAALSARPAAAARLARAVADRAQDPPPGFAARWVDTIKVMAIATARKARQRPLAIFGAVAAAVGLVVMRTLRR